MARPSKEIQDFMKKYGVRDDEVWLLPGGKSYAINHKALERIAISAGIKWDAPGVIEMKSGEGIAVLYFKGKLGDAEAFSFGEASPKNNKNAYCVSMAEKRGKDRVILKLLAMHGDIYSEFEDFADQKEATPQPRQNPHVTRAADIYEPNELVAPELDGPDVPKMKVKDARPEFDVLLKEMRRIQDPMELREWGEARADTIRSMPGEWPKMFKGEYTKHKTAISNHMMAG